MRRERDVMFLGALLTFCLVSGAPSEIVATTDAGSVSVADVEREKEFMSGRERRYREEMAIPNSETNRDVIERIALRVIAVDQAGANGVDRDPLSIEQTRSAGRRWLLGIWRANLWGLEESQRPSHEEVVKDLKGTVPKPPDRIRLSHIYLPAKTAEDRLEAKNQMTDWRSKIEDLGDFGEVAKQQSASQDRDRGGRMGWLQRGFLDESIEQTLFALEAGSVSLPIYFDGGMHLFFVEKIEIDRPPRLQAHVAAETKRRLEALVNDQKAELVGQARAKFKVKIGRRETSGWPEISVGGYTVPGKVFDALSGPNVDVETTIQRWIEDELLFQAALDSDWVSVEQLARIRDLSGQVLHEKAAAKWVSERTSDPTPEAIKRLISAEPQRFRHRLRLQVRAASIELQGMKSPREVGLMLQSMVERLREGAVDWDNAVKTLPPTTEVVDFPIATDLDLAGALGPRVFKGIARLGAGAVSEVVQSEGRLWVVQVVNRIESCPLEIEEAEPKARRILLSRRASQLGREFGDRRLLDHRFELTERGTEMTGGILGPSRPAEQP